MQALFSKIVSWIMAILAFLGFVKPETPAAADPGTFQVNGKVVTFCLDSNPTTGYNWTAELDGDCVAMTRDLYQPQQSARIKGGVGGVQYYDFTAVKPGTATVTFTYARSWESSDSDRFVTARLTVSDDMAVTVTDFAEQT